MGTLFERLERVHGDAPLVEEDGEDGLRLSYAEAAELTARWAGAIQAKITPGDRVVIAAPNGYALVLLYEETSDEKYLAQAVQNARVLAANMIEGTAERSPRLPRAAATLQRTRHSRR